MNTLYISQQNIQSHCIHKSQIMQTHLDSEFYENNQYLEIPPWFKKSNRLIKNTMCPVTVYSISTPKCLFFTFKDYNLNISFSVNRYFLPSISTSCSICWSSSSRANWPRLLITLPSSSWVMLPSPSLSNRRNASRNSTTIAVGQ